MYPITFSIDLPMFVHHSIHTFASVFSFMICLHIYDLILYLPALNTQTFTGLSPLEALATLNGDWVGGRRHAVLLCRRGRVAGLDLLGGFNGESCWILLLQSIFSGFN